MKAPAVSKYSFRVRTRNGAVVENILIAGQDQKDAERKLLQMYKGCEILDSRCHSAMPTARPGPTNYEDVMNLITAIRN